jgi:epoxyqueuosine reductase
MPTFTETAERDGKLLRVVPVSRLEDLRKNVAAFTNSNTLNEFQKIITSRYAFDTPELPFDAQSIIVAATSCYSYAPVTFHQNGREYNMFSAQVYPYDTSEMDEYVRDGAAALGFAAEPVAALPPLKLLGVCSGLAEYGRNNITYIGSLGSYFGYSAYFSDLPPETDFWRDFAVAERCETCGACIKNCKTGAISPDRFLIDTDRCYSGITTRPGAFPDFVPDSAHHTISRCMKCQYGCPMNAEANLREYPRVEFDEQETEFVLSGQPYDTASAALQEKARILGLGLYLAAIPRNIKKCFELIDGGATLTLK